MPVYDYACAECGPFTAFQPMSTFRDPCACPDCGADAPRTFLTAPALAGMSPDRRVAAATNERSRHEPKRSRSHPSGCSCCASGSRPRPAADAPAAKGFPSARPWMISH